MSMNDDEKAKVVDEPTTANPESLVNEPTKKLIPLKTNRTKRRAAMRAEKKERRNIEGRMTFFKRNEQYIDHLIKSFGALYETDKVQVITGTDEDNKPVIEEKKILQFQYIRMDLESIKMHLEDLKNNGPKPAMNEIPMDQSELPITGLDIPGATLPPANNPPKQVSPEEVKESLTSKSEEKENGED